MDKVECVVLGAGVVGLAVASRLAMAGIEVLVLEQHNAIGTQISSRNSEVIHAGIYYPVGSTKAQLCVRGKALLYEHCDAFGVPYRRCGKLIVASHADQLDVVRGYLRKGARNQVHDLTWLSAAQIKVIEPEVRGGRCPLVSIDGDYRLACIHGESAGPVRGGRWLFVAAYKSRARQRI